MNQPLQCSPAAERNQEAILAVLRQVLPAAGTILEIASGTGQHAAHCAPRLAPRWWQPTDRTPESLISIDAWREAHSCDTLLPAKALDVRDNTWCVEAHPPPEPVTAILAINMIHIAPWSCCEALLAGAARILPRGGVLYLYGPYRRDGLHTAPSNAAFDLDLQRRHPDWGVRDLEEVRAAAQGRRLHLETVVDMPANNLSVVFTHQPE